MQYVESLQGSSTKFSWPGNQCKSQDIHWEYDSIHVWPFNRDNYIPMMVPSVAYIRAMVCCIRIFSGRFRNFQSDSVSWIESLFIRIYFLQKAPDFIRVSEVHQSICFREMHAIHSQRKQKWGVSILNCRNNDLRIDSNWSVFFHGNTDTLFRS